MLDVIPADMLVEESEPELSSEEHADTPSRAVVESRAAATTVRFIVFIGCIHSFSDDLAVARLVDRRYGIRLAPHRGWNELFAGCCADAQACDALTRLTAVLLSDRDIRAELTAGRLGLEPFDEKLVQPSSIDVRLDRMFRVFNNTRYTHIDPAERQDELTSLVEPGENEPFVLHPGEFVLGSTLEVCSLPDDLAGRLEGKSSLGRLGLLTHSTAGFIDPGFSGHITLELSNVANLPIILWPGMKIGQLCLFRLSSPSENPYGSAAAGSKYQGQRGPTPSRAYLNFPRPDDAQASPVTAE